MRQSAAMQAAWDALERNDFRYAERAAREALARSPEDAEASYLLGSTLLFEGRFAEARAPLEFADAHNTLGVALINQARQEEALSAFRAALALAPQHVEANNNLGNVLAALGRTEE